jgi:hypothetical protein
VFDELDKYTNNGHFFFTAKDELVKKCNAPTNKSGIFLIYALKGGKIELVYIQSSGELQDDGFMYGVTSGLGGIKESIVNGSQFGDLSRKISWPNQLKKRR